eukprot:COSAG01_NODE_105_length_26080_cov_7.640237_10_plen_219_part_00
MIRRGGEGKGEGRALPLGGMCWMNSRLCGVLANPLVSQEERVPTCMTERAAAADKYGERKHKGYLRKIARAGKEETLDYASFTFDTYGAFPRDGRLPRTLAAKVLAGREAVSVGSTRQTDSAGGRGNSEACGEGMAPTAAGRQSARALHPQKSADETAPACRPAAPAPAFACGCCRTRSGNDVVADGPLSRQNRARRRAPDGRAHSAHVHSGASPPIQ